MKSAFSLIELLVALTILSLVTGAGIIGYRAAAQRQVVDSTVSQIVADLNKASANASAGVKDSTCGSNPLTGWQVSFTATSYTVNGVCGATTFPIPPKSVQLSPIVTLSALPSPNPILFKPLRAGTNVGTSTSVTVSGNGLARYIQVNNFGRISAANDTASLPTDPTPYFGPTPTPLGNIAPQATVTVSSFANSNNVAANAVDGIIGINGSGEWASNNEATPWIQLTWSGSKTISKVVLYDRPALNVWSNGGTLFFSDGTQIGIATGSIPDNGAAYTVNFSPKTVTWVKFQVGSSTGTYVGLSEIQVY